jgi:hypothetical protein
MISWVPGVTLAIVGTFLVPALVSGAEGPLVVPPDAPPASLAALAPFQDALAVAVSSDAALAAAALAHPEKPKSSLVRLSGGGEVRDVEVRGKLRTLHFDPDGRTLFAIAYRPGSKDDVREAWLLRIDVETLKVARSVTLPTTARDIDLWVNGGALLVACRDEIRTVLLPQVRSGPLFWIGGDNRAVASLPGGNYSLVGRDTEILLINLSDPQGRDPLPVRDRAPTAAAVATLAASPDGTAALALLDNGAVLEVSIDPFEVKEGGTAGLIAWLGRPEPPALPPAAVAPPAETAPDADSAPSPTDAAPTVVEPVAPAPPVVPEPAPPAPAVEPEPEISETSEPEPVADAAGPDRGELEGRLTGEAVSEVVAVVLLGPDNITREAARVEPEADGSWVAVGLAPGRYRVVLDGGGGRVLASDPAFRQSPVVAGIRIEVPEIEVLRAIDP